jgi:tRNA(fMet)-specific endonuclease VapC
MKRYLLDTNALADCIFDRYGIKDRVKEARNSGATIGTCDIVLAEIYYGLEKSVSREQNLLIFEENLSRYKCWPLTREAVQTYGRVLADLSRRGQLIGEMDVLIAAIAMTLSSCTIISRDTDLLRIQGLSVENWATF